MLKQFLYRLYERQLQTEISGGPLPRHIGLIQQDGHRRYSHEARLATVADVYHIGAKKTEEVLVWCAELDIPTVTLWALSTDNLARSASDVADILSVVEKKIAEWTHGGLARRLGLRIRPIGLLEVLPPSTLAILRIAEDTTAPLRAATSERCGGLWRTSGNRRCRERPSPRLLESRRSSRRDPRIPDTGRGGQAP